MKLSNKLKHCLDGSGCPNYEPNNVFDCRPLLQKVYERIKEYEEAEDRKNGEVDSK